MPEADQPYLLRVLLDQNVPREVGDWLIEQRPAWQVVHVSQVELQGKPDSDIFDWCQEHGYLIVTFDEDFADQRVFPVGDHHGIVRLRVWPTTVEETVSALSRLLEEVDDAELNGALVIVGPQRIRIRARRQVSTD